MKNILKKFFPWFAPPLTGGGSEGAASTGGGIFTVVYDTTPGDVATKKDSDRLLAIEGYIKNAAAYTAIEILSKNFSQAKWKAFSGEGDDRRELPANHKLSKLLKRPNQFQGQAAFFKELISWYSITGNEYMQAIRPGGFIDEQGKLREPKTLREPGELFNHTPEDITIKTSGVVHQPVDGYQLGSNAANIIPFGEMLHIKTFNPRDKFYGLSPLRVVDNCIDANNEGHKWNLRLLQNYAKPSGLFIAKGSLTVESREFLKKMTERMAQGAKNAGKLGILEGSEGEYIQTSLSPAEMDWLKGLQETAKEILLAFGVPPELGGIDSSKTFANFKEARKSMWEDTIFFLLGLVNDELNHWLAPMFGENISIDFDVTKVPALREDSDKKFERMSKADWLTDNEKRVETGFEESTDPRADEIWKPGRAFPSSLAEQQTQGGGSNNDDDDKKKPKKDDKKEDDKTDDLEHKLNGPINADTDYRRELELKQVNEIRDEFIDPVEEIVKRRFRGELKRLVAIAKASSSPEAVMEELFSKLDEDAPRWRKTIDNIHKGVSDKFARRTVQEFKSNGVRYETKQGEIDIWQDLVRGYINTAAGDLIVGQITESTKNKLRFHLTEAISEGESIDKIVKRIDSLYLEQIIPNRSRVIARTETIRASNLGTNSGAIATGLNLKKRWVTAQDDRVRPDGPKQANHRAAHGQEKNLDEAYRVANKDGLMEEMMFPTDTRLGATAGNVIQCRCIEVYEEIT